MLSRRVLHLFIAGWSALVVAGCASHGHQPWGTSPSASSASAPLPEQTRDTVNVDLSPVALAAPVPPTPDAPTPSELENVTPENGNDVAGPQLLSSAEPAADAAVRAVLGEAAAPEQYTILTPEECLRRAAAQSTMGNLLDGEKQQANSASCTRSGHSTSDSWLQEQLLAYAAQDQRNQSAGQALELYYLKFGAEYGRDAIEKALAETRQARAYRDDIKNQGLNAEQYNGELDREHLQLETRKADLYRSAHELDTHLGEMLGLRNDGTLAFWPETELAIQTVPVDVEQAVAMGLKNRADIRGLELLARSINRDTLDTVRKALGAVNPLLGACPSRISLLVRIFGHDCVKASENREVDIRRRQANALLADRRRTAEAEIRQAAYDMEQATRRVAFAQDTLQSWDDRLKRLEFQRGLGTGEASYFDQMEARLGRIQAEGDMVDAMVKWQIAQVKLRQAMGLLAIEAGYGKAADGRSSCPYQHGG